MDNNKKVDYAYKSYVLREHKDLLIAQKHASLHDYSVNRYNETGEVLYALKTRKNSYKVSLGELFLDCVSNDRVNEFRECVKINHAEYERNKRLKDRVATMLLNGPCLFLTLTFNDKALAETTEKQRRKAVSKYLRQYGCMYVANIDFGSKNHREHYHALINIDKVDNDGWSKKYGAINFERVRLKDIDNDKTKLSKYIAKLTNHAIKETAKRSSLMYSR